LTVDPPAFLTDPAVARILDALPTARVVGGAVRDALAGRPVADIDLATPLLPADVAAALSDVGIRSVPTGLDHGTLTAVVDGRGFEITTLRRDVATDGRRATVAFTEDWREDAARRDFTINAMSMARDGTVFDYFGGTADLRAGRLRFVGDPATRIAEDFLRILRYFRFFARYGAGAPDPAALAAIQRGVAGLAGLSVERVWSELSGLLAVPDPGAAVVLMAESGVLAALLPEGAAPDGLLRLLTADAPADPVLRLAALLTGDGLAVATRLKLSGADRDRLLALEQPLTLRPNDDDAALRRALVDTDPSILIGRAWLADEPALLARLSAMPRPVFPLEGRDIVGMGVPPGPRVGAILRDVRAWWMEHGCEHRVLSCRAVASALVYPLAQAPQPNDISR
jgi:poly(A) polymerase